MPKEDEQISDRNEYKMKQQCLFILEISVLREPRWIHTKEEKNTERDEFLTFLEKERLKDQRQVSLMQVKERRDEQYDVDQTADCSTKQEQNERTIISLYKLLTMQTLVAIYMSAFSSMLHNLCCAVQIKRTCSI